MQPIKKRFWTVSLTALLFVNTVLVALAVRQVGIASDFAPPPRGAPVSDEAAPGRSVSRGAVQQLPTSVVPPSQNPTSGATGIDASSDLVRVAPDGGQALDGQTANRGEANNQATIEQATSGPATRPLAVERSFEVSRDILILINPPSTGGVVHFLLEGEIVSLAPGELARVLTKGSRLVQFHRGDDFGDEELRVETGVYCFAVGDRGWTLAEAEDAAAAGLLHVCRPVEPVTNALGSSDDQDDC